MKTHPHRAMLLVGCLALAGVAVAENDVTNRPPTLADWQALAKLPDLSGVWTPVLSDQVAQERTNPLPWTPPTAKRIQQMHDEEKAGRPFPIIDHCSEGAGEPQEWSIETTSPGVLTRGGWTRNSIKPGDRVTVEYYPLRDGSYGGGLRSVTLTVTAQKLTASFGDSEKPGLK